MRPLATLPTIDPGFFPKMQGVIPEIAAAASQLGADARGYAQRIEHGAPLPGKPVEVKKPVPMPHIEKRNVYLLQDSKWTENGDQKTAAKYSTAAVPTNIAKRAIAKGLAHDLSEPVVARLREQHGDRRAMVIALECVDLETGERPYDGPKIYDEPTIGEPIIGTLRMSSLSFQRAPFASTSYHCPYRGVEGDRHTY